MKRVIFVLLAVLLCLAGCSSERHNEKAINETLELFYKNINKRDFKSITTICSPSMKKNLEIMETFGDDMVIYHSWKTKSINIRGNKAVAEVVVVDTFGNKTTCEWNLVKVGGAWLMDVFNMSAADEVVHLKIHALAEKKRTRSIRAVSGDAELPVRSDSEIGRVC